MGNKEPEISVIMGIYNCANTLEEAVGCIQGQSIKEWELILCDDGSTDNTYEIAEQLKKKDERIVLLRNRENQGLNRTLNRCLNEAKGKYIARMDGDDRCDSKRFEKEIEILDKYPDIAIVSSDMEFFDENGVWGRISHPEFPESIDFINESPFCHAACMVRREAYLKVKGYEVGNKFLRVEDYYLWIKMYRTGYKGMNIHEPLYQMRDDRNAFERRTLRNRLNESYVKHLAVKELKLPVWNYIYILRPILVGLLPGFLYDFLHRRRLRDNKKTDKEQRGLNDT